MGGDHLTAKQQRFVDEYLVDLNGKQAAIRAGYSEKTAEVQASRMLSLVKVGDAVKAAQAARAERIQVDADWVLRQAVDLHDRCVVDDDRTNQRQTLELIGKHIDIAAFKDRTEHSGSIGVRHEDALNALR